jgi:hypothetical protein
LQEREDEEFPGCGVGGIRGSMKEEAVSWKRLVKRNFDR